LRKESICLGTATTGAKARDDFEDLRGPEGPLFHGSRNVRVFFRKMLRSEWGKYMNAESIIMLIVSAGLMVYLLYALLRPERF